MPGAKGAVAMGGPKSSKAKAPIILRPVVTPPASPKGKGWDAPLPAWVDPAWFASKSSKVPAKGAVAMGAPKSSKAKAKGPIIISPPVVTPPVSPKGKVSDDWGSPSGLDDIKGVVGDLDWSVSKSSPAKKMSSRSSSSSSSKSSKAKGALQSEQSQASRDKFLGDLLKGMVAQDKQAQKIQKYRTLVRQGKIKDANIYLRKHGLKIPIMDDLLGDVISIAHPPKSLSDSSSSMKYLAQPGQTPSSVVSLKSSRDSPLSVVELTPSIGDSPLSVVELTPSASPSSHSNYKHDKSFGKLADALAAAAESPQAKGKGAVVVSPKSSRSRGSRSSSSSKKSSSSMDYLKNIHKKVVHRAVSPTFAKHDPKHGKWMG